MKKKPLTEAELNAKGDELAAVLGLKVAESESPDSQGRTRYVTTEGTKTGLGLLRTLNRWLAPLDLR